MKIRIGIGTGRQAQSAGELGEALDAMEKLGFDSLWLSESLTGGGVDPLVGLSWAAAHNETVKLGTTMLMPGRNPVRLAKALASLDVLSQGRLLVTFVPGLVRPPETEAIGVARSARAAAIEEGLPLVRELLSGAPTSYDGPLGRFESVTISPLPVQQPLEFWLGGMVRSSLVRCGRIADGWLPSACTPEEAAAGKVVVEEAASVAGRQISPEHFGVSVAYLSGEPSAAEAEQVAQRARGRDPRLIVPVGLAALRELLERFIEVGFSKFVVRPMGAVGSWPDALAELAGGVGSLQT